MGDKDNDLIINGDTKNEDSSGNHNDISTSGSYYGIVGSITQTATDLTCDIITRTTNKLRFNPFNALYGNSNDPKDEDNSDPCEIDQLPSQDVVNIDLPNDLHDEIPDEQLLRIQEDHFSRPLSELRTAEELSTAIAECRLRLAAVVDSISEDSTSDPNPSNGRITSAATAEHHQMALALSTDRGATLVHQLIALRLRLNECQEINENSLQVYKDHRFIERFSRTSKRYCEFCLTMIWGLLQRSFKCLDCGYTVHSKCLSQINRKCVAELMKHRNNYITVICAEVGLGAQKYQCIECHRKISFLSDLPEARLCDYNGHYYCSNCHWNDLMTIPARVARNWDFQPRKVCRSAKQYLKLMYCQPSLNIGELNGQLYRYCEELSDIKKIREQLIMMKNLFIECNNAMRSKLLLQLSDRQHFVENSSTFSLKDLCDVVSGQLIKELTCIHSSFAQHIKVDCLVCQTKGDICKICDLREVIFHFEDIAISCDKCFLVYHRHCYLQNGKHCSNCSNRIENVL